MSAYSALAKVRQLANEIADACEHPNGLVLKAVAEVPDDIWPVLVAAVRHPHNDAPVWALI